MLELIRTRPEKEWKAAGLVSTVDVKLDEATLVQIKRFKTHHLTKWRTHLDNSQGIQALIDSQSIYSQLYFPKATASDSFVTIEHGLDNAVLLEPLYELKSQPEQMAALINNPNFSLFRQDIVSRERGFSFAYDKSLRNQPAYLEIISPFDDHEFVATFVSNTTILKNPPHTELTSILKNTYHGLPKHS